MDDLPELPPEKMAEILECIYARKKIEAIKLYKLARQTSLFDAKQFVEELEAQLRATSPEKFKSARESVGCLVVLSAAAMLSIGFGTLMLA